MRLTCPRAVICRTSVATTEGSEFFPTATLCRRNRHLQDGGAGASGDLRPLCYALLPVTGFLRLAGAVDFPASSPKLPANVLVLAEFTNTTGEAVFDGTLRQGLSSQLEQSPFLNLLSDQRIGQTLSLVEGSISSLGAQYVLGLTAVSCSDGKLLAEEQATADRKENVLKALGQAATKLRQKLGESRDSIQKYDVSPERVTTSSLEALQAYSLGRQAMLRNDYSTAISQFQRAISLDPNFAMAYALSRPSKRESDDPGC